MWIVFLGVDGSGKSTIINLLSDQLKKNGITFDYVHLKPSYLRQEQNNTSVVSNPHQGRSRGIILSIIKIFYFVLEYNYAYYIVYKRSKRVILFDRYYYDLITDPKRMKCSAPVWIKNIFMKLIPKPDLIIYLHATVEKLYKRKKEITKSEIAVIADKHMILANKLQNFHKVSTMTPIEETFDTVNKLVNKLTFK